ncbi:EAL domain-containing protein [Gemmatimonas aurantiaca]|uniref:putative bifunctional diguanylate cyclase/phosphodiesterase n=1 Tax=Gemmatimonas aurantiaca TaxID=173480 RepID=UPI00301C05EF
MRCPTKAIDETARLQAITEYALDSGRVETLDSIVDMAARMFDCPVAAVNIIGDESVRLISSLGIDTYDPGRDVSFCAHTILQDDVMVIEDATLDVRFHDNPLVSGGMIRFYAGTPLRTPAGQVLGALCVIDNEPHAAFPHADQVRLQAMAAMVMDKLELRRLQTAVASPRNRFEAAATASPNAILCFDADGRITEWNPAASTIFDHQASAIVGHSIERLVAEEDRPKVRAGIERVLAGAVPTGESTLMTGLRASGEHFAAEIFWTRWFEGDQMQFAAIVLDISAKRSEHDALHHFANYDALTGLPNHLPLRRAINGAIADGAPLSLIVADLDGFADISTTLGHAAGDTALATVSDRLVRALPDRVTLYSIGTGEFAALLAGPCDHCRMESVTQTIRTTIARPLVVNGQEVRLTGNCGLAFLPEHAVSFEDLVSAARLALFRARIVGRGGSFVFEPGLRSQAEARRMHEAELHRAFERQEFALFYQPQFHLKSNALVGAEALIRWKHPERGWLSPAAFLPALENGPLVVPTGRWILETACAQAAEWRRTHPDFRMSVNLFAAQLRSGDLPGIVQTVLQTHDLPAAALELEITENIALEGNRCVAQQLEELRRLGIQLSFDDFGTGFASLTMLRDYPVTHIKIDKSFTQVVQTSDKDRAIVMALIALARDLELRVTAEGIESRAERDFLKLLGCEKGQGYFFGRPVPADLFAEQFFVDETVLRRPAAMAS